MNVAEIMTTEVMTVGPDTGLKVAARTMVEHGVSGLPVIGSDGRIIGIITEADFVAREAGKSTPRYRRLLDAIFGERVPRPIGDTVESVMTHRLIVTHAGTKVAEAARQMTESKVKRLPVVDGEMRIVGIVSRADIMAAFARPDDVIEDQIRNDVIRRVLMLDPALVKVSVRDGVAHLAGDVPTATDSRLLTELSGRLEGVVRVESDVHYEVDDSRPGL